MEMTGTSPRREYDLTDGWTFALNSREEQAFLPVRIPHDWAVNTAFDRNMEEGEAQGFRSRFGIGWYRRELTISGKNENICYYLEFGGIYEESTVRVNGQIAGGRKYGYSSFTLDVTEFLREGLNRIEIKVDNTKSPSDRWYSGAGLYRTVKLVEVDKEHFDPWEVVIHTQITGTDARVIINSGLKGKKIRAELAEEGGCLVTAAEGCGETLELTVEDAKLWSAENPNLYLLTLSLLDGDGIGDRLHFRIGLRTIEMISGKGMVVNGTPVKIKGVCLHQDVGCLGIAARKEIFKKRLLALKEMGCNAIRPAHHTFSSDFLELCDEMGFYVYEECFDKWHGGLYGRYFQTEWQSDVDAMVKRDRNRPCIFMWGVGNEVENQGQESMLATLKLLTEYVRTLDNRPVSYAMNPHFKREDGTDLAQIKDIQKFVDEVSDTEIYDNKERVERIAGIAQYVDVIGCNYQEQWYPLIHERIPDKLILGTEVYQYFMGDVNQMQNFTDTNPVLAVLDFDYVIGSYIWAGIDYLGESMGYPAKGWGGSLIRTNGNRRPGFYLMQSYWSEEPMVHFSVMDYSLEDEGAKEHWDIPMLADHWHFPQFRKAVIPYRIVSNCEEVHLYLNGKRIYIPHPDICKNHEIMGFLPYQPGKVEAVGFCKGAEVCRHTLQTPGVAVQLGFSGDAWIIENNDEECVRLPAEKGYQIQLTIHALDDDGNPCFRESAKVRFRIEGPAELLAVDAGELTSNETYQSDTIHLFHGQASVMIALTGESGKVCVYADAAGMRTGCRVILV